MSVTDDILAAVAAAPRLDASTKAILADFVRASQPILDGLAPAAVGAVMSALGDRAANGGDEAALAAITEGLDGAEVVAALTETESEMSAAADARAAAAATSRAAIAALGQAALTIVARLLVSAL